jgi:hypothetical protein
MRTGFDGQRYAAQLTEEIKARCLSKHSVAPTLFMAVFLIVAGVVLFLGNLGWLPIRDIWKYWPLLMIGGGIAKWMNSHSLYGRTWGFLIIAVGTVYLALTLGLLHVRAMNGSWPLSLLFIVFGVAALARVLDPASHPERNPLNPVSPQAASPPTADADALNETAVLGSLNRRFETVNFKGGIVTALLGSVELDLRRAQINNPSRSVTIEVVAIMGSAKLRIPETWRLGLIGTPILGSYEDKTIPRSMSDQAVATLMITGSCIMGSIEIEN